MVLNRGKDTANNICSAENILSVPSSLCSIEMMISFRALFGNQRRHCSLSRSSARSTSLFSSPSPIDGAPLIAAVAMN